MKLKLLSSRIFKNSVSCFLFIFCAYSSAQNISGIINTYAKITAIDTISCPVNLTLTSSAGYNVGDTVLIIQMKGAVIDTTNTSSFGTIFDYTNAGNYEFCTISKINGNVVGLKYKLLRSYDPSGLVQLIRVPYYNNVSVSGNLTAQTWNGSTGGVLVFQAAGTITFNANINVSGLGFRGGNGSTNGLGSCSSMNYHYPISSILGGQKGEGIAEYITGYEAGRGALANGGGGGNNTNSGGAGGGNYGAGGRGGDQWNGCPLLLIGGDGGNMLSYSNVQNKIFLGGGGGGGHQNDNVGTAGTPEGGIVIIKANTIVGNGTTIFSKGNDASNATLDGAGGGGAGGTVLLDVVNFNTNLNIQTNGGVGGNAASGHGPGGGGSGGLIWYSGAALPANVIVSFSGGVSGSNGSSYGAASGQNGSTLSDLNLPQSNTIPMGSAVVNAGPDEVGCQGDLFSLNASASGGTNYVWSPSNYLSSTTGANVIASPTVLGAYSYTISVTDANGCYNYDGITITVATSLTANAGTDRTICSGTALNLNGSGGQAYTWSPSTGLSSSTGYSVVFGLSSPGMYNYTLTASSGLCSSTDGIMITVTPNPLPTLSGLTNATVCYGNSVPITISGATYYTWSPSAGLNTVTGQIVVASPTASTIYSVTGTNISGCVRSSSVSVFVSINPLPSISIVPAAISICAGSTSMLSAIGNSAAQPINYLWQPSTGLSSNTSQTVAANPATTSGYTITGTDANGCYNAAKTKVTVNTLPTIIATNDATICKGLTVTLSASGGNTYSWSPATNPTNGQTVTAIPNNATTYTVTGTDQNGCSNTAIVKITTSPVVVTSQNETINQGESVVLSVTGNGTDYSWTPGVTLTCNSCSSTTASPTVTTLYLVTVTDNSGCSIIDTITVTVENNCGGELFIPDAFSPNGDGENDVFYIKTKSSNCIQKMTFKIFDRWGSKVFESSDITKGWDGKSITSGSGDYSVAVFVYSLQATLKDRTIINKKGNITLIK